MPKIDNKQPLVSIISPCYNGEKYLKRFLDSILAQTYNNIEFIFVNDGSTDNTEQVVMGYKQLFEEKGIDFKYIFQENSGLGGAINAGLKKTTGDFLSWPDSDDFLSVDSVEKKLDFLLSHEDYAAVSSSASVFNEDNFNKPLYLLTGQDSYNPDQFDLMLHSKSIFCPGCHMVRMSAFIEANPQKKIYPARRGQNWQMLLPVYYKRKRGYIAEPLYNYVIYSNSMSRGDDTEEKKLLRVDGFNEILMNIFSTMLICQAEKDKYVLETKKIISKMKLDIFCLFQNKVMAKEEYVKLKNMNGLDIKTRLLYSCSKIAILSEVISFLRGMAGRILRYIKRLLKK